ALFPELETRFPGFRFLKADVAREELEGAYDLVAMIDVTQHIVDESGFVYAMSNLRARLAPDGVAVLTAWLSHRAGRRTQYEVERPRAAYEEALQGCALGVPRPFRDKFIFAVRPAPAPAHRRA
ncbi:MAG: class I SAM-dependent methyltransferase, partial [Planctomycetota bacterium]